MIKFNRTFGSAGYIKTLLGKTLLGALFIFLFTSCASSPSSPSGEGGLKISFQNYSLRQAEGVDFEWSVQLNKQIEQDVSFDWSIEHVTTSNDDFRDATEGSGIITVGSTTANITIKTNNDNTFEDDESFRLNIINIRGATLDNSLQATGTITDEEDKPTISLDADFRTIAEGDFFTWSLQLSKAVKQDVSFDWSIKSKTIKDDFIGDTKGSSSIVAGSLKKIIAIQTKNDRTFKGDKNFSLNITNITIATPNNLKITNIIITDDADNSKPVLFIPNQKTILKEGESDTIRVSLNNTTNSNINFSWQLQDGSNDFIDATGLGSITANSTTTDIVINASNDNIYEATEDFRFTILSDTILSTMKFTQIYIDDRDDIPSISITEASADETDGVINFELTLSNLSEVAIPFSWSLDELLADSDFAQTSGTGNFAIGSLDTSFDVVITNDEIYEGDETFTIAITNRVDNEVTSAVATIRDNGDFPTIDFQEPSLTQKEGEDFVWHLQLSNHAEHGVSFDWSIEHVFTDNNDFIATTGSGSIAAASTQASIIITTSNDSIFESNESFRLNVTNITSINTINIGGPTLRDLQATGTITDEEDRPTISLVDGFARIIVEGEPFTWSLRLTNLVKQDVSFDWSIAHSTTNNDDFIATTGSGSIAVGSLEKSFTIQTRNNDIFEGNESFDVNITNISLATPDNLQITTITIADDSDNLANTTLLVPTQTIILTEGKSDTIIVELTRATNSDINFSWQLQGGSNDFIATTGSGSIAIGSDTTSITITTSNDNIYEATEDFRFTIASNTNLSALNFATIKIDDRDDIPSISIIKDASANEDDGTINFELTLGNLSEVDIPFSWSLDNSLGAADSDFAQTSGSTGIFVANQLKANFDVAITNDEIYEGDETFGIIITNEISNEATSAVATIKDSGDFPSITLEPSLTKAEGEDFVWHLQLSKQAEHGISFEWSIAHSTTTSDDFIATTGSGSIAAGSDTTSITIKTSSTDTNNIFESDESFDINITNITIINIAGPTIENLQATGTITDEADKPTISFATNNENTIPEGEDFVWTVKLSKRIKQNVSFDWYIEHGTTNNDDFKDATFGSGIIVAGSDTTSITIKTSSTDTNDLFESDESFDIKITNINILNSGGATLENRQATGTIKDGADRPTISLDADFTTIDENSSFTWTVKLSKQTKQNVSFDWSIAHSTTNNDDFDATKGSDIIITAGSTTTDITIITNNDNTFESDESFDIKITNINILNSGGVTLDNRQATGTIKDEADRPTISVAANNENTFAEVDDFVWTVKLSNPAKQNVSFDWSIEHVTTDTNDFGSVIEGNNIIITAGSTATDITIITNNDNIFESDESFMLNITNISIATPDNLRATGTITDAADTPRIFFEVANMNTEEGGTFIWTVKLSNQAKQNVSFDWSIENLTTENDVFEGATKDSGIIAVDSTTTTITIKTRDNDVFGGNQSFDIKITNIKIINSGVTLADFQARGIITDNVDSEAVLLFVPMQDIILTEGTQAGIRVELNKVAGTDVAFTWQLQGGIDDFIKDTSTAVITAGNTTTEIVINASDDNIYEATESFVFTILSNTRGISVPDVNSSTTISIDDDDDIPSISIKEASADEDDGTIRFELTLSNLSEIDIPFSWSLDNFLGATDSDFAQTSGEETIGVNLVAELKTSFDLVIINDATYEEDETFGITITNKLNNISSSAQATIKDEGDRPIITLGTDLTTPEGDDVVLILNLNKSIGTDIRFNWEFILGNDTNTYTTNKNDFRDNTKGEDRILAGSTQAIVNVKTSTNDIFEGDETFGIEITNILIVDSGIGLGDLPQAIGTITDNEDKPTISVVLSGDSSEFFEGAPVIWRLQSDKARKSGININFDWSIVHGGSSRNRTDANDFAGGVTTGSGSIAGARTHYDIIIRTAGDEIRESTEYFSLNITNITNANQLSLSTGTVSIKDNILFIPIDSAERLSNIRYNLGGTSYKTSYDDDGEDCNGAPCEGYELTANIDLSNFNLGFWDPIGGTFSSTFRGNGYSISELKIDKAGDNRVGLFSRVSNATIDNLIIEVVTIKGGEFVGALAGEAVSSVIDNIQIKKTNANSVLQTSRKRAGALIGRIYASSISNASSDLNITATGRVNEVGGLVGLVEEYSNISYSKASGTLRNADGVSATHYGGLVGNMLKSTVSYSSTSGKIIAEQVENVGGLVGILSNSSKIDYSWSSAELTPPGITGNNTGGLVGSTGLSTTITNSWTSTFLTGKGIFVGQNSGNIHYSYSVGRAKNFEKGFIGENKAVATKTTNNYWNSETSGITTAVASGTITTGVSSSDTASMLASRGITSDTAFSTWSSQIDANNNNAVWSFESGSYPVLRGLDAAEQSVNLAYGLLRLEFIDNLFNNATGDYFATLDVNLLAPNETSRPDFFTCRIVGDNLVSQSANGTIVELNINLQGTSDNLDNALIFNRTNCSLSFDSNVTLTSGNTLRLDAKISKGSASRTKVFARYF